MYQEETGTAAFSFGPEMVYEAAALYVVTEETLHAVLHLPLLGKGYVYNVQAGFPTHFAVKSNFSTRQGGGIPGCDGGRLLLPRADGGGVGFVPRAGCHPCLRRSGPEDAIDGRLSASAVLRRGCRHC